LAGSEQEALLLFYPGTSRQRAKFLSREGHVMPISSRLPGAATIDDFFAAIAQQIAQQPWLANFAVVFNDVTLGLDKETWLVRDRGGDGIPLRGRNHWKMLAVTAGRPFDLAGEWDGYSLKPLGLYVDETYRVA
jgi:hypothetical protein